MLAAACWFGCRGAWKSPHLALKVQGCTVQNIELLKRGLVTILAIGMQARHSAAVGQTQVTHTAPGFEAQLPIQV